MDNNQNRISDKKLSLVNTGEPPISNLEFDQAGDSAELFERGGVLEFPELRLRIEPQLTGTPPVTVVHWQGRIANNNSYELNRKANAVFGNNHHSLIMDLSGLEYINSSGVAILFSIIFKAREKEAQVVIGGMHPFLSNVFRLMDLPGELTVFENVAAAQAALVNGSVSNPA